MSSINAPNLTGDIAKAAEILVGNADKVTENLLKTELMYAKALNKCYERVLTKMFVLGISVGAMWATVSILKLFFGGQQKHIVTHRYVQYSAEHPNEKKDE